tara:strand:+ start:1583 stop:1960 length:378 start_codon:yes stop_codon:yes gene_type:complete
MSLKSSLQYQIVNNLKKELDIQEYDIPELMGIIFKNCRVKTESVTGVRLSKFGLKLMEKSYTCYHFPLNNFILTNKAVVKMDRTMLWPYYIDNKKLVLFSEKDSVILKLKGQNLEKWLNGLREPK